MDKLLNTLTDYLNQAAGVVTKYAPQVWDATLQLVRIQAIVQISLWTLCVGITIIWWTKGFPYFRGIWVDLDNVYSRDESEGATFATVACSSFAGILHVVQIVILCNSAMDWILAIYNPRLFLVYHIAQKAGLL